MAETRISADDLRRTADRIGGIMSDDVMAVFHALDDEPPTAGSFPTAQWLHDRTLDRLNAVKRQAQILKVTLTDFCTGLHTIADQFSSTDTSNGQALVTSIDDIENKVVTDTGSGSGSDTGSGSSSSSGSSSGSSSSSSSGSGSSSSSGSGSSSGSSAAPAPTPDPNSDTSNDSESWGAD